MAKAKDEPKTKPTETTPKDFIAAMEDGPRKADAEALLKWMTKVTGLKPKMWGGSIVGYGRYAYTYDSGHSGEMCLTGFSPRKANMVLYILPGYSDLSGPLSRLGKHKIGKSCLYINKLADVDMKVLEEIVTEGLAQMRKNYQSWDA
ncbi:DUF1801 domain-containing protein [Hyphomonas sp.]|jgi:hypothetical protein|uniref:DUF1801 domain-containing protein n=1 Tax=Hyphomonas sp. TaxID=87 RepID=UPI0025C0DCE5|nr:DUF1801 domain-containing protein [Hyphomonas sp.]